MVPSADAVSFADDQDTERDGGAAVDGACTGTVVAVNEVGQATVTVPAMGAVGIDGDAMATERAFGTWPNGLEIVSFARCCNFRLAVILAGSLPGRSGGVSGPELHGRASQAFAGTWLMECRTGIFLEYPGSERGRHVRRTWSYPRKSSGQEGYRVA
jgi:hypothetical protein